MSAPVAGPEPTWAAAAACTLPTIELPLRQREFDELFRSAVQSVTGIDATTASFLLRPDPAVAARTAELIMRETQCCSFFTFGLTVGEGELRLEVKVAPQQHEVLTALLAHAEAVAGRRDPRSPT